MGTWTPGPWRLEDGPDGWVIRHGERRRLYAGDKDDEGVANLRLMTAAPDLLEACQRAATLLWHARTGPDDPIRAVLDAAIAKATKGGRS